MEFIFYIISKIINFLSLITYNKLLYIVIYMYGNILYILKNYNIINYQIKLIIIYIVNYCLCSNLFFIK